MADHNWSTVLDAALSLDVSDAVASADLLSMLIGALTTMPPCAYSLPLLMPWLANEFGILWFKIVHAYTPPFKVLEQFCTNILFDAISYWYRVCLSKTLLAWIFVFVAAAAACFLKSLQPSVSVCMAVCLFLSFLFVCFPEVTCSQKGRVF